MKVWNQFGSEHSANLVMIGHFKDVSDAVRAKEVIDELTEKVSECEEKGIIEVGGRSESYGQDLLDFLSSRNIMTIGPRELEQFLYDVKVELEGEKIVVTTDEVDVSAFLKLLIDQNARIEVYSAHAYPDTEFGRGK